MGENILDLNKLRHHIQALDAGDDASRRRAIQALKEHDEKEWAAAPLEATQSLVESLQNQLAGEIKQTYLRHEVVTLLGNIGPRANLAVPQLIELLQEGNPNGIRENAAIALGKIGKDAKKAVDALINLLATRRSALAIKAVRALGDIGCADQKVRTALVDLWLSSDQSRNSQVQVAIALCKLKIDAKDLVSVLTNTLGTNQDSSVRKLAAEALAWCNKNELDVVPALLAVALGDKDEKVREVAEASLAQMRLTHEKAIHLCATQLKQSVYAERALKSSGQLAVPALIEALGVAEPLTREKAARTLAYLGELATAAVPALTKALRDADLSVRLDAAKGLWNITKKADDIVPVLVDLLNEKGQAALEAGEARRRFLQTVIEALCRIGPPASAAVPALIEKTKHKHRLISESALSAVRKIAPAVAAKAALR